MGSVPQSSEEVDVQGAGGRLTGNRIGWGQSVEAMRGQGLPGREWASVGQAENPAAESCCLCRLLGACPLVPKMRLCV